MSLRLVTLLMFAGSALAACGGNGEPVDTDVVDDDDDDDVNTDTADSTTTDPLKSIAFMQIQGLLGWDADAGQLVDVTIEGQTQASTLLVYLGSEDWDYGLENTDDYCTIAFDVTGLTAATWAMDEGQLLAFDVTNPVGSHDCDDFDTSIFGGDVAEVLATVPYKVGLGGELDPALADQIVAQLGAEALDLFTGGYFGAEGLISAPTTQPYAQGLVLDENMAVVVDDTNMYAYLTVDEMPGPAGLVTGFYIWASPIYQFQ